MVYVGFAPSVEVPPVMVRSTTMPGRTKVTRLSVLRTCKYVGERYERGQSGVSQVEGSAPFIGLLEHCSFECTQPKGPPPIACKACIMAYTGCTPSCCHLVITTLASPDLSTLYRFPRHTISDPQIPYTHMGNVMTSRMTHAINDMLVRLTFLSRA